MHQRHEVGHVLVNESMEQDGVVDPSLAAHDLSTEITGQDVDRLQRSERRSKAIDEHAIFANRDADMPGVGDAQAGAKQHSCRATDIEFEVLGQFRTGGERF